MVKTNMSSNGPSLGPDPNSDSRKLSCRSETAVGTPLRWAWSGDWYTLLNVCGLASRKKGCECRPAPPMAYSLLHDTAPPSYDEVFKVQVRQVPVAPLVVWAG